MKAARAGARLLFMWHSHTTPPPQIFSQLQFILKYEDAARCAGRRVDGTKGSRWMASHFSPGYSVSFFPSR